MKMKKVMALAFAGILTVSCLAGCGGGEKKSSSGDSKTIEITYWKSGLGEEWLKNVIAGFEKKHPEYKVVYSTTASQEAINAAFGSEDSDTTDLYLGVKKYETDKLEPLNDVLEATVDGESKAIKDKFSPSYLALEQSTDGNYYNLTCGGGMLGIVYNKALFEDAGITQAPRTTDELALVCDTLTSADIVPFCHFKPVGYWEDYMSDVFFVQYDGMDYVMNNFYACKDDAGKSPSIEVFKKKDGRYEALKVFEKVIVPEYTMQGSSTYDHTTIQTMWLKGEAAMMVNGSWIENEMASTASASEFEMMRMPVVSSITDKLTTVKTEEDLRNVITAIDSVTDGQSELSAYQKGEDYEVNGLKVSAADWECIRLARNTVGSNYSGNSAYIPNYADAKDGAKEFLKYLYSDEGYKIFADTLHVVLPISLSEGELDTSDWSHFAKGQVALYQTTEQFATRYIAGAHPIFTLGGATRFGTVHTYVDKFCTNNVGDRITASEAWDLIQERVDDNYENNWLKNIK